MESVLRDCFGREFSLGDVCAYIADSGSKDKNVKFCLVAEIQEKHLKVMFSTKGSKLTVIRTSDRIIILDGKTRNFARRQFKRRQKEDLKRMVTRNQNEN